MSEISKIKFPVFVDEKGNRFIFPSIREDEDHSINFWQCMELQLMLNIKEELPRLVVDVVDGEMILEHVKTEALHRHFLHGAATIYLIGGPEFDECLAEGDADTAASRSDREVA